MHIINLKPNQMRFKIILCALFFIFAAGCVQKSELDKARSYVYQSEEAYEKAVDLYKGLISEGKDPARLHFELGSIYYGHGDYLDAIAEFKQSDLDSAIKPLAISYYKSGNFVDALEVFSRQGIADEEYMFYYGLTCEELNLFDKALDIYRGIKDAYRDKAAKRLDAIEKSSTGGYIGDIDNNTDRIIAGSPVDEYPEAGALILRCDEKIEVTADNKMDTSLHYIIQILNERGKEDFSEAHIDYDSTFDKVELEYARTIKPNGQVVNVGERHIRDVSKYMNFPLYSNARVFIISFPEVSEGAVIEYKLKIRRNRLINKNDFVLNYPLQTSEPVIAASFNVVMPDGRSLNIKTINQGYNDFSADVKPKIENKDGSLSYIWEFKDIPQIIPEANMPPISEVNPAMLISTFSSWRQIYDWWWPLAKDKIKADNAITDKVEELTKDAASDEDKIKAIYNFCAQNIRYVAVEYGQAGYEPHPAADIFANKYGDCKDQSILLITMLKQAGFPASPVLIATKEYFNLNRDFPSVLFNHCIASVLTGGKLIFLDPTAETCAYGDLPAGDQNRSVLVIKEDGYDIADTASYPAAHNLIRQEFKVKINPDESISGEKIISSRGLYDQAQRYWLLYTQPELVRQILEEKIQEISIGARLGGHRIENLENVDSSLVLSYTFLGPEYFTDAGNLRIMPQLSGLDTGLVAKDTRKYGIDFAALDLKELIFEIELPQGFVVNHLPSDIVSKPNPWIDFRAGYSFENNKIIFKQTSELKKLRISLDEYADFKDFYEQLAREAKQRIVLEKK